MLNEHLKEKMALIFVDTEAFGGAPSVGRMTEFGAVEYKTLKTFHGVLWTAAPNSDKPVESRLDPNAIQKTEEERRQVFLDFERWLYFFDKCPVFVSDNNGYDFMWVNDAFWKYLGRNPFGHSSRRITDFYAGLKGNFYTPAKEWKRLRVTKHDHNPIHDSLGNIEAFKAICDKFDIKV
jgi:hypothetical protein